MRSNRLLPLFLGLIVVIAGASALWRYVAVEDLGAELVIVETSGEVRVHGSSRSVDGVEPGTVLQADDRVQTGDSSRAVLALGSDTRIRLGPTSSLQVRAISEDGVSLELENGALEATVRPESGAVRIGNRGREVIATNADFEVGARDEVLQVTASRGELSLVGVDVTRVDAGSQAIIVDRKADVGPISEDLLLAVEWPEGARTREPSTVVTGRTVPGAVVRLHHERGVVEVQADGTGSFRAEVPLAEGENEVRVEAVDVLGHQAEATHALQTRDTQGPTFQAGVEYLGQ